MFKVNLLRVLACMGLFAMSVTAQTFTTLHSFTALSYTVAYGGTNSDGIYPNGVILSGNTLYGTAPYGGISGNGTVFAVSTTGTGFTNLYNFTDSSDGAGPQFGLILSGNTLYGTTESGGSSGFGAVFSLNNNGTGFTTLHSFSGGGGGVEPITGLILSGNTLYGTTSSGGSSGNGTVFAVSTNGMGFTNLYSFTGGSDGASPQFGLILSGNTLYGTAGSGGSSGVGTVFSINTSGNRFKTLHSFSGGNDGGYPFAGLILSGQTLYGTTRLGGSSGNGTVFTVSTKGTSFTNLHSFSGLSDGTNPRAGLILSDNMLFGTTFSGGSFGLGTVFTVSTNGTRFSNIYNFSGGNDGANPEADLILSGNTFYGTTFYGGSPGNGTVFSLSLAPPLTIIRSGTNVIVRWPTNMDGLNYSGFALQSTTNLVSPIVWTTITRENVVTNHISGTQQFYRLTQ